MRHMLSAVAMVQVQRALPDRQALRGPQDLRVVTDQMGLQELRALQEFKDR